MDSKSETTIDEDIKRICQLINKKLGFMYGPQKKFLILSRLNKRLQQLGCDGYRQYLELLERDSTELNQLFSLLTTNVTSFFREDRQLTELRNLLPQLLEEHSWDRKICCWSAGCSSGEEPYTLAIILRELLGQEWDFRILATDVSTRKLNEAMNGKYSIEQVMSVPNKFREKYFQSIPSQQAHVQIVPQLREKVIFRRINLIEEFSIPSGIRFDLIFCRNVFIYFKPELRDKTITGFHSLLTDRGLLFLGMSETINAHQNSSWQPLKLSIYQKK